VTSCFDPYVPDEILCAEQLNDMAAKNPKEAKNILRGVEK